MGNKSSNHGLSFTATYNRLTNVLQTQVTVESAVDPVIKYDCTAIWDTGAQSSLITKKAATALGLKPISKGLMSTPSDKNVPSNIYVVNIHLPNKARILRVRALEGDLTGGDVLIGMDIISLGDFAVTNYNMQTVFSFRMPSMATIDFCKHSFIEPIKNEGKKNWPK